MQFVQLNKIFVFGSNLAGRHGKGAALFAIQNHGAIYGQGIGRQGNSYAIPTKDQYLQTLSLKIISRHVENFLAYARAHSNEKFSITKIGCGLAGYKESDISPMFKNALSNCELPKGWRQ